MRTLLFKVIAALVAIFAVSLVTAGSANAVGYDDEDVTLSTPAVAPGGTITIRGEGYAPVSIVELELHSDPISLGSVTTDNAGAFVATVEIPEGVELGSHHVWAVGVDADGNPKVVKVPVRVGSLPMTGLSGILLPVGLIGAGAVAVGASLVMVSRRRAAQA